MVDLVAFGVILDDLVFPDGRTAMGVLGGGGPQTAFGMRLPALAGWAPAPYSVGLVSGVGPDLPQAAWKWLESAGIDLTGLRRGTLPTARAWQIMEHGEKRTQLFRVPGPIAAEQLGRSIQHLPESYRQARGYHLGVHPEEPDLAFLTELRGPGRAQAESPMVSVEPFKPADHPLDDHALGALCSASDIFSPNLHEARSLAGDGAPNELARRFCQAGARVAAVRLGQEGSLIYDGRSSLVVPAAAAPLIDPTGAGNAYCGAFLAVYLQTGDIRRAGLCASVAASLLVQQIGLPPITAALGKEARRRLSLLESDSRISQT
ncbi:MAG: PfkB family carbohydrate kinase [Rudaea sp.]